MNGGIRLNSIKHPNKRGFINYIKYLYLNYFVRINSNSLKIIEIEINNDN